MGHVFVFFVFVGELFNKTAAVASHSLQVPHKLVVQHQKRYYDWLSRKTSVGVRPPDPEAENGKQRVGFFL